MSSNGAGHKPADPHLSGPERRARLAAEGRVVALLEELERTSPALIDPEELWGQIRSACRAGAESDPARFGLAMLDEAAGVVAYLAARAHHALGRRLAAHDRASRDLSLSGPPDELQGRTIDALMKLQNHLASILERRATLERRWQAVDGEPASDRGKSRSPTRPDGRSPRSRPDPRPATPPEVPDEDEFEFMDDLECESDAGRLIDSPARNGRSVTDDLEGFDLPPMGHDGASCGPYFRSLGKRFRFPQDDRNGLGNKK